MPLLSIIIVNYNTKSYLIDCIESIYKETHNIDYEIIIIDNASEDGSIQAIESLYPQVKVISLDKNVGFAMANNIASKHAKSEYLLLLNPDTVILDSAIDRLILFSQIHPNSYIWGGRTLYPDGSLNPASCWRKTLLWEIFCRTFLLSTLFPNSWLFNSGSYAGWDRSSIREVDIVSGCFLLIRRDLWIKLRGFSSEYFMYGEEADLCLRAKYYGARPIITPDATIIHYGGASEKAHEDKMIKLLKAKRLLMRNHWPKWKYIVGKTFYRLYPLNRTFATKLLSYIHNEYAEQSEVWLQIWKRRDEWLSDN